MRGVIVSSPFTFDGRSLHLISSQLDPTELRRWVLYWDEIDWPVNNILRIETGSAEVQLLEAEGVLTRTDVTLSGSFNVGNAFVLEQAAALVKRSAEAPGAWSVAQRDEQLYVPDQHREIGRFAELELLNLLPTPHADVPLEDVLEFKSRRSSELGRLRAALDSLYLGVVDSADPERALLAAKDEVTGSVESVDRVLSESRIEHFFSSTKVSLDLPGAAKGALAGGVAGASAGLVVQLAVAGAIACGLKASTTVGHRFAQLPERAGAFAYLGYAKTELGAD